MRQGPDESAVVVVTVGDSIEVAAQKLWENRLHRLPWVDQGRLVGILSTLDLVRLVADGRVKILRPSCVLVQTPTDSLGISVAVHRPAMD